MIAVRRFVVAMLVLATIVGVVALQRSRPGAQRPGGVLPPRHADDAVRSRRASSSPRRGSARGCPSAARSSAGSAVVANPARSAADGQDHGVHRCCPASRPSTHAVRGAARGHHTFDLGSDAAAGHVRVGDGRDLRRRWLRRAARRQRVGQRRVVRAPTRRRPRGTSPTATRWRAARNSWSSPTRSRPTRSSTSREATSTESRTPQILQSLLVKAELGAGHQPGPAGQARTGAGHHRHQLARPGGGRPRPRSTSPRSAAPGSR